MTIAGKRPSGPPSPTVFGTPGNGTSNSPWRRNA